MEVKIEEIEPALIDSLSSLAVKESVLVKEEDPLRTESVDVPSSETPLSLEDLIKMAAEVSFDLFLSPDLVFTSTNPISLALIPLLYDTSAQG